MFYDNLERICRLKGIKPAELRKSLNIKQSTMASWKARGITPGKATVEMLGDYLDVPVGALYDDNYDDSELIAKSIRARPYKDGTLISLGGMEYFTSPPIQPSAPTPDYWESVHNVGPETMARDVYQGIGSRIRDAITRSGLTSDDLAQKTGIPAAVIEQCERGDKESLTGKTIFCICVALDANLSDLVGFPPEVAAKVETLVTNLRDISNLEANNPAPPQGNAILATLQKETLTELSLACTKAIYLSISSEIRRRAELKYYDWIIGLKSNWLAPREDNIPPHAEINKGGL